MPWYTDPFRPVSQWFGARASGGYEGVTLTDGIYNEFIWDLSATQKPGDVFPVGNGIKVIAVNATYATGTVSAVTIGGVAVLAATEAAPVSIPDGNTGVLAQTGGTGGKLIVRYINLEGDATHNY